MIARETISEITKNDCVVMSLRWWKSDAQHSRKFVFENCWIYIFETCGELCADSETSRMEMLVCVKILVALAYICMNMLRNRAGFDTRNQTAQRWNEGFFSSAVARRLIESHVDGYIHECMCECVCVCMHEFHFLYRFHINLFVLAKYVLSQ